MSLNDLIESLQKIDLAEAEAFDRGQGLEPLLQEFVYDVTYISDEDKIKRTRQISDYYNTVYNRCHGNTSIAYKQTHRWAEKIYFQHWAKKKKIKSYESLNEGAEHDCFRNAAIYAMQNGGDVVHGTVTNKGGKTFLHAWVEEGDLVTDPTSDAQIEKSRYYQLLNVTNPKVYNTEKAAILGARNGHWGPWESVNEADDAEKNKFFEERTKKHIGLVKRAARKIVDKYPEFEELIQEVNDHDASKFEEPEREPYIELTWNKFKGIKDTDPWTNEATLHHIINNTHHPEYWNKEKANLSAECRDESDYCIDVSKMSDLAICEMVADWQAMSEELKKNTARQWFNKQQDTRWHFNEHQVELIDKLLKVFGGVDESIAESAIDFPQAGLPEDIWDKKDGKYILKPSIKEKVLTYIKSYPGKSLLDIATEVHICGSLATNLHTQYSDFDVHITVDPKKAKGNELVKEVGDWSEENPADIDGHPCQIYIQENPSQDYVGDSCWNLLEDFWIKGPKISTLKFNPYDYYSDILDEVEKKAKSCDVKLGSLSRNVIDYASVKDAYHKIPKSGKADLRKLMKEKLKEIEADIETLSQYKKQWVKKRRNVSQPKSIQQAVTDKRMQEEWEKANAIFKFLAKYDYLLTIKALEDILEEDDVLDDEDITAITKVLGIDTDFDKVSPDLTNKEK